MPRADTRTVNGKLQTTVPTVPDAPIGRFDLRLLGGTLGYPISTRNICRNRLIRVGFVGQNGKTLNQNVPVDNGCGGKSKRKK